MEKAAGRLTNIVLLGFFSFLLCLPIVTAGGSFTALAKAMNAYLDEDEDKPLRVFFAAFRQYFGIATKIFLLHVVFIAILVFDLAYYRTGDGFIDHLGQVAVFGLLATIVLELSIVFTLIARDEEEGVFKTIRKAIDIALLCPFEALGILVCNLAIILAGLFIFRGIIIFMPGIIAYIDHQFFPNMFRKYRIRRKKLDQEQKQRGLK